MLKTSKLLTVTVPKATYSSIRKEAQKRNETVSGLLRRAFDLYKNTPIQLYTDKELRQLLKRDALPTRLVSDLKRLTRKK